ncbi:ABC transporter ATP-binding protein [Xinfangfangia sp. CPCC 101601]|uniref:ABC transporter ATP-binding protein n=1 Tax=Pseudogemmobacter lacusdianii TaxID=3069608 RepID=A0ABU0W1P3_9RHOB|nr:ABC transporter ATP-binding protein [Xinfangfangia sp. CPCC 101601]MDQ2067944.1 ABC transporter ATP-binding protein [Xinfangfangia sp. CPCC 101601]
MLLEIKNLEVVFPMRQGDLRVLHGIDLAVEKGEILGLVGESGSGKSVLSKAVMGLLAKPGRASGGEILFQGQDLLKADAKALRSLRGNRIAMIFQDPMATLNPVLRIDAQMLEAVQGHRKMPSAEARRLCIEALRKVGIPAPEERFLNYPHQLSGGMRQRIAIATALLNDPDLILADEATTALDVTIQAQILSEMKALCRESGTALVWVTHDLAVVSGIADRIAVMYAGRIVECGPTQEVLSRPKHPYTQGLLDSVPSAAQRGQDLRQIPGLMPSPSALPPGCAFNPRCLRAKEACRSNQPVMTQTPTGAFACFNPLSEGDRA